MWHFYNFGDVGQNEDDRIVSGYKYEGVVVPQIQYLDNNRSVALKDNGFTIYHGSQIPKEVKTVKVDKEIVSTFYDNDMIGLVFKNDSKDKQYYNGSLYYRWQIEIQRKLQYSIYDD